MPQYTYYISHSGTKGMRWGVRRYQNKDGTLTEAGKERYRNVRELGTRSAEAYKRVMDRYEGAVDDPNVFSDRLKRNRVSRSAFRQLQKAESQAKKMYMKDLRRSSRAYLNASRKGTRAGASQKDINNLFVKRLQYRAVYENMANEIAYRSNIAVSRIPEKYQDDALAWLQAKHQGTY